MPRKKSLNPAEVGARIKEIRGDLTLEEFGDLLGVANPTVYRYETDRIPTADTLLKIAALDPKRRGIQWLTTGDGTIYKDAVASAPMVSEAPEDYGDRKRARLVRAVKELARHADDDVIDVLLKTVEAFMTSAKKKGGRK